MKRKPKQQPGSAPAFFAAVGIVGSLLLLAAVLPHTGPSRSSFGEPLPRPTFEKFLPAGARVSDSVLELPDLPQHSYVFGYVTDGDAWAGIVSWDKEKRRYAFGSPVKLAAAGGRIESVASVALLPLGTGAVSVILIEGPSGISGNGVFVLMRQDDGLRYVSVKDPAGNIAPAYFRKGSTMTGVEELKFEDVNADGRIEAVQTIYARVQPSDRLSVTDNVYGWQDDRLVYEEELTWALNTSKVIFPEPAAIENEASE